MKKKYFVITKHPDGVDVSSNKNPVYNFLMKALMKYVNTPSDDLPIGEWYAKFSWQHSRFIPGILYREL